MPEGEESRPDTSSLPTDSSLLRRLRSGNQDAATQLYVRYADRLRLLARAETAPDLAPRMDIDDIIQSVFSSFFRGVRLGYYDVPHGDELWKLFLVIALNKIRAKAAYHRAGKRDVRLTQGSQVLDWWSEVKPGDSEAAHTFLRLVIEEAMETLTEPRRRMIHLRIEGYEVAEIADRVRRSKRTVERTLQEFRTRLADILRQDDGPAHGPQP